MRWLIWKEFRLNWLILAIAALCLIVPYVVAVGRAAWGGDAEDVYTLLEAGWMTNVIVATVFLALLGGQSIACERADRSAEFLAYQPVSRGRILLSKLVWPAVAVVIIFGLNTALFFGSTEMLIDRNPRHLPELAELLPFLAAALGAFCIAWGISAFQNSPTFAVMGGIVAPAVIIWLIMMINWWMSYAMTPLLVLTVYAASIAYLRRVEP
jgi:ABC-type transport system involved in multi-copper enzyme maturation permease subunit